MRPMRELAHDLATALPLVGAEGEGSERETLVSWRIG